MKAMPSVNGISTYQTYLMYRTTTNGTYNKLIDITSFPDLIPPAERIDITTLSDYMRKYINGIGDTAEQTYGANYTPANFQAVEALKGHQYEYAVWFGASGDAGSEIPDGHYGKFAETDVPHLDNLKDTLFRCFEESSVRNACKQFQLAKERHEPCPFSQNALDTLFAKELKK